MSDPYSFIEMSATISRDSPAEHSEKWQSAYRKAALYPTDLESRPFNAEARVWVDRDRYVFSFLHFGNLGQISPLHTGINFSAYANINVSVKGEDAPAPFSSFDKLKLHPILRENIQLNKYKQPTPIQSYAIPVVLMPGKDLMACAQTGSGKTAAFLIPIVHKLLDKGRSYFRPISQKPRQIGTLGPHATPIALILLPTRELTIQTFEEARKFAYRSWVNPAVIYGGAKMNALMTGLDRGAEILAATPGKLLHMLKIGNVSLSKVRMLVIDEVDRMLEKGFEEDIRRILRSFDMPQDETRQTLMFSATYPKEIRALAGDFLLDTILITVGRVGVIPSEITQTVTTMAFQQRQHLKKYSKMPPSPTLIFVSSKRMADSLDNFLYNRRFPVTSIHADRNQKEREDAMNAFKRNKTPIMVATDIAARGLDVPNVTHVINFDLPPVIDDYIHRVGRTARVGNPGRATSFFDPIKDSSVAAPLARVLQETKQEIPEFLKDYLEESGPDAEDELCHEDLEGERPQYGYDPHNRGSDNMFSGHQGGGGGMANAFRGDDWGFNNPSQTDDHGGFDTFDYKHGAGATKTRDEWAKQDHGFNNAGREQPEDW
ncbi:P-loop containing nucleoside triphosphate hydrolase protein [Cladochytrium replicatum]|nr:P-loop containing nucleoside triphosphate hydrolase protein [Cladochytrium replicatum]